MTPIFVIVLILFIFFSFKLGIDFRENMIPLLKNVDDRGSAKVSCFFFNFAEKFMAILFCVIFRFLFR